jgi:2-polyprenyl-3-methyl-5-hydroxy-6-metoxy-1,4-benzoquinol methylase
MTASQQVKGVHWIEDGQRIACVNAHGVVFADSLEHWREAVLRLLNLSDPAGRVWVEAVAAEAEKHLKEDALDTLRRASARIFPRHPGNTLPLAGQSTLPFDAAIDHVWYRGMGRDPNFCVVGSRAFQHGVLAQCVDGRWSLVKPLPYEEEYFEGNKSGLGYGSYRAQAGWRLEKAARLVRKIRGIAQFLGREIQAGARLLDVGSGYGYFSKAAADSGWKAQGVEISRHAASVAKEFGVQTFIGGLAAFAAEKRGAPYDIVTLFDVIEHVEDPVALLRTAASLLAEGGLCVVRTPNLLAIEGEVMGPYYHSLKAEHLHCFSAPSLARTMLQADLHPAFFTTESHLFRGFLGPSIDAYACSLRGSDLFAVAQL